MLYLWTESISRCPERCRESSTNITWPKSVLKELYSKMLSWSWAEASFSLLFPLEVYQLTCAMLRFKGYREKSLLHVLNLCPRMGGVAFSLGLWLVKDESKVTFKL